MMASTRVTVLGLENSGWSFPLDPATKCFILTPALIDQIFQIFLTLETGNENFEVIRPPDYLTEKLTLCNIEPKLGADQPNF